MNEFDVPLDLASCPHCRSLVVLVRYVDGRVIPWDPRFVTRRGLVARLGIATWADWLDHGQGWGLRWDQFHCCPPDEVLVLRECRDHDAQLN